jgi:1-acyl-sn-glycerol-3-phosphate acyltransferase
MPRAYRLCVAILRPLSVLLTRRDWRGSEHFPDSGGFVVTPNHTSNVDPIAFAHFMVDHGHAPRFLAKESVFRVPVVGRIVRAADQIPVHRGTARASDAFTSAVTAVEAGKCVAILPEGTLTRDPDLWPMTGKTGAARVALATRCPVIPVAQWGPERILAPYTKVPHLWPRRTVHVWAGPAVDLSDLYDREVDAQVLREATDRIMAAITAILEQIRSEHAPAQRFDPTTNERNGKGSRRPRRKGGAP